MNCEYYKQEMCIYFPKDLDYSPVFQACLLKHLGGTYLENFVNNCKVRKDIEKLKEKEVK